ncbi:E2F like domain containing transcription factor with the wHTH fold [Cryptosporidium bovis]|uniref:E2F like domain containing transcription factor with the wHTH fold n=1 Tax=Cryptosporidium bovis TaxID=310047 RepID=UPI00351A1412|nr:E2F like domain containing transcription factor with the wHTH fold [Cryptosporidium bovis]
MNAQSLGGGGFVPGGYPQHAVPVPGLEQHHPGQYKIAQGGNNPGSDQLVPGDHTSLPHLSLLPPHHLAGTSSGTGNTGGPVGGAGGVGGYGGTPNQMRNRCKLGVFSHRVCEKVSAIKVASYHEMTEHLINMELGDGPGRSKNPEAKNIRRRVYDVLNVLLAIGVVRRSVGVGKNLIWAGLDPDRPLIDQLVERSRMDHTGRLSSGPDELRSEEQARAEVETAKIAYLTAFEAQVNALQETVRQRIATCNDKDIINVADYIGLNQLLVPVQHPHLNHGNNSNNMPNGISDDLKN